MNLNYELQALQEDQQLEILSAPSLLVLDGKEAEIKQGQEVPYTSQSGDYINTSFREANLSLKVTPKILQNDLIILDVNVTNDNVDETNKVGEEPLINRQEITTSLYLENNVTVVIGGIKGNKNMEQISGIPLLKDIPLLGWLFKSRDKKGGNYELMIFLTPTIVTMNRARQYSTEADSYFQYEAEKTGLHSFSSSYERPLNLRKNDSNIPDEAEK
jgi:type IV pilus assembly protein PilQ